MAKNYQLCIISQVSNSQVMGKVHKKELDIRRLKHFHTTFEVHPNYSKIYFMNILRYW